MECIKCCNLLSQDSVDIYVELLCFVAENEKTFPAKYNQDILLLKYSNQEENVQLCSISQIIKGEFALKYALDTELHLWLSKCNMEFSCLDRIFFLPSYVQKSLTQHKNSSTILSWLSYSTGVSSSLACDLDIKGAFG